MNEKFVLDFIFYDFVKDSVIHSHFCLVLILVPEDLFYLMTFKFEHSWLARRRS